MSWQATLTSFDEVMRHFLETNILSDVTFVVGKLPFQKTFKAHKIFLAARSNVFEAMFYGSLPENQREIPLPDINADVFEIILRYVYTEELKLQSMDQAIETYLVANKYNFAHLMLQCSKYIERELNPENLCFAYEMAILFDSEKLKNTCEQLITEHTKVVLESDSFAQSSLETIKNIIRQKCFEQLDQLVLFEAILKWGNAQMRINPQPSKTLRQVLNPLLPRINFLHMSHEDFFHIPAMSGIFDKEEMANIAMNICAAGCAPMPNWSNMPGSLRSYQFQLIYHDCTDDSSTICSKGVIECQILPIERDVVLDGLSLYVKYSHKSEPKFFINDTSYPIIPIQSSVNDNQFCSIDLIITEPFLMKQKISYHVRVDLGHSAHYCNFKPIDSQITLTDSNTKFVINYVDEGRACKAFQTEYGWPHFYKILYTTL